MRHDPCFPQIHCHTLGSGTRIHIVRIIDQLKWGRTRNFAPRCCEKLLRFCHRTVRQIFRIRKQGTRTPKPSSAAIPRRVRRAVAKSHRRWKRGQSQVKSPAAGAHPEFQASRYSIARQTNPRCHWKLCARHAARRSTHLTMREVRFRHRPGPQQSAHWLARSKVTPAW